jgi:hypothetical protein
MELELEQEREQFRQVIANAANDCGMDLLDLSFIEIGDEELSYYSFQLVVKCDRRLGSWLFEELAEFLHAIEERSAMEVTAEIISLTDHAKCFSICLRIITED